MGQLSETQIKAIKTGPKEFFLNDGDNLFLRVRDTGKAWVYRYEKDGKTVKLGLGPYPAVTLAQARAKAYEANSLRADGQDLKEVRRQKEERERAARLNTFELLARAWVASAKKDREWSNGYADKVIRHLEIHIFPWVGDRPIDTIAPTEIVRCLHRIKDRGNLETAQRVREAVQHVYQYAVDLGALEPAKNFVNKRTGGLPSPRSRHYAAITDPGQLGQLLRDIRDYNGAFITRCALRLAPMVFQRPGQLRLSEWQDIDLDRELWRCPPEKMKMREWQKRDIRTPAHLVPLPRQATVLLRDLHPLTGPTGPVFRSMSRRSEKSRYISDNTINAALRSMGYDTKEQITGHGFRATARTMIREHLGWDRDVIERHLAHVSDEELGGSYDRATFLVQRKTMVQQWADFLDDLEAGKMPVEEGNVRRFVRPPARPALYG
ncbi:integrase [Variovorax paradoxus]|jgi:integrase|uniref:tyrosine-type recombinase/integrase n=1 Tax=Variovorax paradoxus TaxID=34073 RepID=UPI0006E5BD5D|nr:integrase [Variovorax paradoxus]KPV11640.1 integrase [Variovorax paradoxus]KPV13267.1 integrase [Variovorax paradoxus]KPV20966.1 integrase [Variovorax paradoxus]KPV21543.1 integrase [Variovorax paradoxus]